MKFETFIRKTTIPAIIISAACLLVPVITVVHILTGCTQQQRAKHTGGTMTEMLPVGSKLVNITWKDGSLWYLTRPMRNDEVAEEYMFQELSAWGIVEGAVIIKESKLP